MIRLHHCHQTRSMRTLWLLHELGVEFKVETYPFDKSLREAAFAKLNPLGRVPALEIGGSVMTETGAMAEYLCDLFPDTGLGRAAGGSERMEWLTWLHFAETVSQHTAALTQQHIALYEDAMRSPIITKLEAKRLARCFDVIDAHLRDTGQDWLLPSGFSAADIGVGQAVYMGQHFVKLDDFAFLTAWVDRIKSRPAFQASLPPEGATDLLYHQDFYPVWEG